MLSLYYLEAIPEIVYAQDRSDPEEVHHQIWMVYMQYGHVKY